MTRSGHASVTGSGGPRGRRVRAPHGERPPAAVDHRGHRSARPPPGLGGAHRAHRTGHPPGAGVPQRPGRAATEAGAAALGARRRLRPGLAPAPDRGAGAAHPGHRRRVRPHRGDDGLRPRPGPLGVHAGRGADRRPGGAGHEGPPRPHRRDRRHPTGPARGRPTTRAGRPRPATRGPAGAPGEHRPPRPRRPERQPQPVRGPGHRPDPPPARRPRGPGPGPAGQRPPGHRLHRLGPAHDPARDPHPVAGHDRPSPRVGLRALRPALRRPAGRGQERRRHGQRRLPGRRRRWAGPVPRPPRTSLSTTCG